MTVGRGTGSARIFCPSMRVGLPRWATCCRSCICVASRRVISPPALAGFFGSDAGLSASTIGRLLETWSDEYEAFEDRDLSGSDYVYVWADGVHFRIRLEEDRLCCLVVIGVKADGSKELLACADGYRESTESWADVLRGLKKRGMGARMVAVGDGAPTGVLNTLCEVSER